MRRFSVELTCLPLQIGAFYGLPLLAGPGDEMGVVALILLTTFGLALAVGGFSRNRARLVWPVAVAALFLPTVYLYYNESALIHSLWYGVLALCGMVIGVLLRLLIATMRPGGGCSHDE